MVLITAGQFPNFPLTRALLTFTPLPTSRLWKALNITDEEIEIEVQAVRSERYAASLKKG